MWKFILGVVITIVASMGVLITMVAVIDEVQFYLPFYPLLICSFASLLIFFLFKTQFGRDRLHRKKSMIRRLEKENRLLTKTLELNRIRARSESWVDKRNDTKIGRNRFQNVLLLLICIFLFIVVLHDIGLIKTEKRVYVQGGYINGDVDVNNIPERIQVDGSVSINGAVAVYPY